MTTTRKINSVIFTILSALVGLSSCTREPMGRDVDYGKSVYLDIDCLIPESESVTLQTRATYDENCLLAERKVLDLYIYVFSAESGDLIGYKHVDDPGSSTEDTTNPYQGYKYRVTGIKTQTGNAYICAVANPRTGTYKLSDEDFALISNINEANLSESHLTRGVLESIIYQRTKGYTDILDGRMVFSGYYNGGNVVEISRKADGSASITGVNGGALNPGQDEIQMSNIVSKSVITITGENFIPQYYELHNVPFCGQLMPSVNRYHPEESRYESLSVQALPSKSQLKGSDGSPLYEADGTTPRMGTSINVYLPQNLAGLGSDSIAKWSDREKNTYNGDDKHFVNAPELPTYIVIYGQFDGNGANRDYAEARFTVHLGDFSTPDKMNNYDVRRGVSYHYNIDVRSVDDIVVEAMTDESFEQYWNHATEGVVITPNAINPIKLDCHYEARAFGFDLKEVYEQELKEGGYITKIDTYFDETPAMIVRDSSGVGVVYNAASWKAGATANPPMYPSSMSTIDSQGAPTDSLNIFHGKLGAQPLFDYRWIKVVKNTQDLIIDANHAIQDVCKYPGDGDSRIMTVFEFLHELYKSGHQNENAEGNVDYYTFFFDENYYPTKSWDEYTNKIDKRYFYIANEFHESMDTKSIYTKAKYVFEQESIWQVYDTRYATGASPKVAYGKEIFDEDQGFDKSSYDITAHDDWNGYSMSAQFMTGQSFAPNDYNMGHKAVGAYTLHSQDTYKTISAACLSRNRDENGNGVLDADEIHWYLPSIGQMSGYFMGDDLYVGSAKTFDISNFADINSGSKDVKEFHYFTCSDRSIFWAEEGASTSSVNSGAWSNASRVRCTRTLESRGEGHRDPDTYYVSSQVSANGKNFTDLSIYIADGATRGYNNSPILPSYGREVPNRLYKKFRVADENLQENGADKTWNYNDTNRPLFEEIDNPNDDICAKTYGDNTPDGHSGWRVPNMRELSVMENALGIHSSITGSATDFLWCNTQFSGHKYAANQYPSSYGFGLLKNGLMTVGLGNGRGHVRCVRDVSPTE